jgi:hypothetical protein
MHDAREVSVVRYADLEGGPVRRVVQVLGIALMAAGLLLDAMKERASAPVLRA